MAPAQHLNWLKDNRDWFAELPATALAVDVPACPGCSVENVITHLTFGLGLGYPHALAVDPNCPDDEAFADVPWPSAMPDTSDVFDAFRVEMDRCIQIFESTDPAMPCYTYQGPGIAAFWVRRAAIETTLHRMDVVEALGMADFQLRPERTHDAIAEAVEFALPLAARWTGSELPGVLIKPSEETTDSFLLGTGPPAASISGRGVDLLSALWGRSDAGVVVDGDVDLANAWMALVETAFAGR